VSQVSANEPDEAYIRYSPTASDTHLLFGFAERVGQNASSLERFIALLFTPAPQGH
jgi:hypothetical protein